MTAHVAALYRHPVKGFTPEPLEVADLKAGGWFPGDRMWAVENGPSGYDAAAPEHMPKQKFTVLMRQAILARVRTRWDDAAGVLHADFDGEPMIVRMDDAADRNAFADRLTTFLGDEARGPLRLIEAGPDHRFMDSHRGKVSVLNLNSVRDLAARLGRPVDPLRFRANIWVEGLAPWVEIGWARPDAERVGPILTVGSVALRGDKSIVRCAATEVDPATGERDMAVVKTLHDAYGHTLTGLYCSIETDGRIALGDPVISPA